MAISNFESFETEDQLRVRIDDLLEKGYETEEIEVYSPSQLDDETFYCNICFTSDQEEKEPSIGDRIKAFFAIDEPQESDFDEYEWTDKTKAEACTVINNGYYILHVNREGYYTDPKIIEERAGYFDSTFINRPDLSAEEKIRRHEDVLRTTRGRL